MSRTFGSSTRSSLPFRIKREAFFHLTNNFAYLLIVVLSLMMPLSMIIRFKHNLYATILLDLPIFVSATFSVSFFYVATQREIGATWWERIKYLPEIYISGEILDASDGVRLHTKGGNLHPLKAQGWQHF